VKYQFVMGLIAAVYGIGGRAKNPAPVALRWLRSAATTSASRRRERGRPIRTAGAYSAAQPGRRNSGSGRRPCWRSLEYMSLSLRGEVVVKLRRSVAHGDGDRWREGLWQGRPGILRRLGPLQQLSAVQRFACHGQRRASGWSPPGCAGGLGSYSGPTRSRRR